MAWFDANNVDPATGTGGFPIGNHAVVIKSSAKVPTKDNSGGMLVFTCEIIDGPHKGGTGLYRLNIWNSNSQAAEIAGRQLSALCHVVGRYKLENDNPIASELFNLPFRINVQKQKDTEYTEVVGVTDINGAAPSRVAQQPAQQPQNGYQPAPQQQPAQQPQPQQSAWQAPGPQQAGGWQQPQGQAQQPAQQPQQQAWQQPQQPAQPQPGPQQPAPQQPMNGAQQPQPSWQQQPTNGAQPPWQR